MIEENRPQIRSSLQHVNELSQKLDPLIQDLRRASSQATQALDHIDAMIGENRADVRKAVAELRQTLGTATDLTSHLDQSLDVNAENIDELLENMRHVTENLKEFTDTVKTRPYTLIRASNPREHRPGGPK
jgi:ABC-type transporter Mla subunit MlaD